jgi:tetratricopeptide (TPR) repeat protein
VLSLEELWKWDEGGTPTGLELHRVASAWLWFHYLSNARREQLRPGRARSKAASLHRAAEDHLFGGSFTGQLLELGAPAGEVQFRALSGAEVHAALSRVRLASGSWERARAEAERALALDDDAPAALEAQVLTEREPAVREALARRFAARHPKRAASALLHALNLPEGEERSAALERALELDPHDEVAMAELALARLRSKRRQEAEQLAERAVAQAPYSLRALVAWPTVLGETGQCPAAASVLRRAIDLARGSSARQRLEARLDRYRRCAVGPVASAAVQPGESCARVASCRASIASLPGR